MRLQVNPIMCDAHGLCAELLPELIRLDDWGYPIIDQPTVPQAMLPLAKRAASACPTLALLLEEEAESPTPAAVRPVSRDSSEATRRTGSGRAARRAG